MKRLIYHMRRPLSWLLAVILLVSTLSVGLTVWAGEVSKEKEPTLAERLEALTGGVPQPAGLKIGDTKEDWQSYDALYKSWGIRDANTYLWAGSSTAPTDASFREKAYEEMTTLIFENYDFLNATFGPTKMPGDYWKTSANFNVTDDENYTITRLLRLYYALYAYWRANDNNWGKNNQDIAARFLNKSGLAPLAQKLAAKAEAGYTTPGGTVITREMVDFNVSQQAPYLNANAPLVARILLLFNGSRGGNNIFDDYKGTGIAQFRVNAPTDHSYLTYFPTIADLPDGGVQTQALFTTQNASSGWISKSWYANDDATGMFANAFGANGGVSAPDTTSKGILQNFQRVFSSKVLNMTKISELSSDERKALLTEGQGILDSLGGWSAAVAEHFFPKTAADTYTEANAFAQANAVYTMVKELTERAETDFLNAVNTANNNYGTKDLTKEDLSPFETLVKQADDAFSLLNEEQLAKQEIIDAAILLETLRLKLSEGYQALYAQDYQNMVTQLIALFKQSYVQTHLNSNPVMDDNALGVLDSVAKLYFDMLQLQISFTPNNYTAALLGSAIAADVQAAAGADFATYNMEKLLKLLACDGTGTNKEAAFVTVGTPLLHTYRNISDIPENVPYTQTTLTYHYIDGKLTKDKILFVSKEAKTDIESYRVFNNWAQVFSAEFMEKDLATLTREELLAKRSEIGVALNQVKPYSAAIQGNLLKPVTLSNAKAKLTEVESAIADYYVRHIKELKGYYDGLTTLTFELCLQFLKDFDDMAAYYNQIDSNNNQREDVLAAQQTMVELKEAFKEAFEIVYLDTVKTLDQFLLEGTPVITMQNVVLAEAVLEKCATVYDTLTEAQKQKQNVVDANAVTQAYQVLVQKCYDEASWSETTVDYQAITNATTETISNTIGQLDSLIGSDFFQTLLQIPEGQTLGDFLVGNVEDMLYTDDTINMIMKMVYPMVWQTLLDNYNAQSDFVKGLLDNLGGGIETATGLNSRPQTILKASGCIDGKYQYIRNALNVPGNSWDEVRWSDMKWTTVVNGQEIPVHDFDTFTEAMANMLNGIWALVRALLFDVTVPVKVLGITAQDAVPGRAGYQNVVYPFLMQLGCKDVKSYDTMKANSDWTKSTQSVRDLLRPIVNRVKEIGDTPIQELIDLLPTLSYIFHYDMVTKGANDLLIPLGMNLQGLGLNIDLSNINALINSFLGDTGLNLPLLNTGEIAGIAKRVGDGYAPGGIFKSTVKLETKQDEMFIYLMRFILDTVKTNPDLIDGLLANADPKIAGLVNTVLSQKNDTIINSLMGFLNPKAIDNVSWDMTDWSWEQTGAAYPADGSLTSKDVKKAVEKIDLVINALMKELMQTDLTAIVNGALFTADNLNNLTMTLYRALGGGGLTDILKMVGVDASQQAVASAIRAVSPEAATRILAADGWTNVDLTGCAWNVANSDEFALALSLLLQPFNPLLKVLLAGENITLLDSLTITGADGYNNAILPILKALGCKDVLSDEVYLEKVKENENNMLLYIIVPLFDTMNEVLANPVGTLAAKLPNFANFMANGGLTKALNALLLPITNMADPLMELFAVEGETPNLTDFILDLAGITLPEGLDLNNLENSIIPVVNSLLADGITVGETTLNLQLKEINWATLAGHGTQDPAARMKLGKASNPPYFEIESDTGDTAMAVLNYFVDTLKLNQKSILDLVRALLKEGIASDPSADGVLNLIESMIVKLLQNPTPEISGAIVKTVILENPADVDWSAYDFFWKLSETIYPADISQQQVEEAIANVDKVITGILRDMMGTSLNEIVGKAIYTTENLNAIVGGLYGALAGQEQILDVLGITLPTIDSLHLDGTTRTGFVNGLSAALAPFGPVLKVVLTGENLTLFNAVTLKGANGYKNSVMPILYALGCENVLSLSDYKAAVKKDDSALIAGILNPILDLAERIMDKPMDTLTSILPTFAYFVSNQGFSKALNNLLLPLTNAADPVLSLVTDKSLLNFVLDTVEELTGTKIDVNPDNLEESLIPLLNSVLSGLSINGSPLNLQLPSIDWAKLAGCGELKNRNSPVAAMVSGADGSVMNKYVEANQGDALVAVMNYVVRTLNYKENATTISTLIASANIPLLNEIVGNVLHANANDLIAMVINLLAPTGSKTPANWVYYEVIRETTTKYTKNLTREQFAEGLKAIDANILGLLKSIAGIDSLTSLLSNGLYTQSMMNTIAGALFGALNPETLGMDIIGLLQYAGIDLSPKGIAAGLTETRYRKVVNKLNQASVWSEIDFTKLNWGFEDGDKDGFIHTIAAMLRPLDEVLAYVLAGQDLVLFGGLRFTGGEGYNNAVIPLLEALGCGNVISAADFKRRSAYNSDFLILDVIEPLLNQVEVLLEKPVETLTAILPNFSLFMANNGVQQLAENLLLPVTDIMHTIAPAYPIQINLSALGNINVVDMVNGLLEGLEVNGEPLQLKLLPFSFKTIASRGEQTMMTSKRVDENGKQVSVPYVKADQPAVLVNTLRYLVNTIKDPANLATIKGLTSGIEGLGAMVGGLLDSVATMATDDMVEMLMSLLAGISIDEVSSAKPKPPVVSGNTGSVTPPTTPPTTVTPPTTAPAQTQQPQTTNPGNSDDNSGNDNQEEGKKANWPLIIGCSAGGLVILGLAVFLILRKRKMKLAAGVNTSISTSDDTANVK